ncbi:MAG: Putative arabinose-binding protein AraN [Thermocaproicibacter melissae]|jgi:arabinosaccharide transport system substrate-binding protein|uniref:ABC transporter substrate-binding protein n=1 Tax=Thermocaproicibacter melissae TaxID=2966552 RepID=UPI003A100292
MKRFVSLAACLAILLSTFSGCSGGGSSTQDTASNANTSKKATTDFTYWTYQELHISFMKDAVQRWNTAHPDEQINLKAESYPVDDMHSKLQITLQSGQGAPDLVDINVAKFSNFTKGNNIGLVPLNDIIEKDKDAFLQPVLDIYKKNGNYYGIDYHVGAPVMFYNTEILGQAGIKPEDIKTWNDLHEAGKKVKEKTGKPIITFETNDSWCYYIMITEQKSDYFDRDGKCIINNDVNKKTLKFMLNMINDGTAATTPGGGFHTEEYYKFMGNGGAASMLLPFWYMDRFTDYMPQLKGKMAISTIPVWEDGDVAPVFGGTATSITTQCQNQDLAKRFLFDAKISPEGAVQIWNVLGFDPLRWDVWTTDAMKKPNKFTEYFGDDIFDVVLKMKDNFYTTNITDDNFSKANDLIGKNVLFKALGDKKQTPEQALDAAAKELQSAS